MGSTTNLILVASGDLTLGGRTRTDGSVDIPDYDHTDANVRLGTIAAHLWLNH